jgi:hypothetical protein
MDYPHRDSSKLLMMRGSVGLPAHPGAMTVGKEEEVPLQALTLQDRGERENSIEPPSLSENGPLFPREIIRPRVIHADAADQCELVHTSGA